VTKIAIGRREQNKQEKRARIITAARALFRHKGFDATTTQEIADAAGVASGTVFTYASTKDELLILVFHAEMMDVIRHAYAAAKHETALIDQVTAFFDVLVVYHERDLQISRALMRQLGYVNSDDQRKLVAELMTSLIGRIARLVEAHKGDNTIPAEHPAFAIARSMFAIYYLHLGGLLNGYIDRAQFDRIMQTDLGLLLSGLLEQSAIEN
jgi:AcrR family transcriptional regulator